MNKIKVTVAKLDGSVSFEVREQDKLIIKDTINGKCSGEFHKEYLVNSSTLSLTSVITGYKGNKPEISINVID
ncbi:MULTISPECIES: hypothetical protein [Morganellaceae]|uniref:Uncharacterized protein n=1 Tax=Providencia stuartii ATCC 25827 TaxID=471874 RepID=A0AA86YSI0_PROST|nr:MULTISPECIES: hypothetical protein [Morganellaceae]EDU57649.1 hypothetical protein PROSTU_04426 [Providencia stuartii ATCC 25827]MBS7783105.1 hypothetical protein [Providencia thailandensis]MDF4173545.1 hypothetical protein [Providencia thailandensis]MTC80311.1 hypothetical protein [Providencia stuartii]QUC24676.1 hypothetical protein JY390_14245 [Providencia stuartii]